MASTTTHEILKAVNFAAEKHKRQRRKGDDSPYVNHPIGVAFILSEAGVTDVATLQGAILHDTVEDTDTTLEEIEQEFGTLVRQIVADVSDDKSLPKRTRKEEQVAHAAHVCPQAKLVKLADKLHNFRDLTKVPPKGWDLDRVRGYFVWGRRVTEQLRGENAQLDAWLDELFASTFVFEGGEHVSVLPDGDPAAELERYYRSLEFVTN